MINKQKCPRTPGNPGRPKDQSKAGNEVRKGDGIEPLSYDPVKRRPYWEAPPEVVKDD